MAIGALVLPASASASVVEVSTDLAKRNLRPAPLIPTTAPRSLSPVDSTLETAPTRRRSAYAVLMRNAFKAEVIDSVIFLEGGEFKSLSAARRNFRGSRIRSIRVRGHRGYLVTKRIDRTLLWSEGGRVYEMGSGTPRTVSLKELRATAEGLDTLVGGFSGSVDSTSPSGVFNSSEAFVAATRRTVSADFDWTADCTTADGRPGTQRAGRAVAALQTLRGGNFSVDIAPFLAQSSTPIAWQGTATGSIGARGGTISWRVTAVADGENCDSGQVTIPLKPGDGSR